MNIDRKTIIARANLGTHLTEEFKPLEAMADDTAIKGLRFLALALEKRRDAALPPASGADAVSLLYRACQHSFEAQALLRDAHALWPGVAAEHGLHAPECPPKGAHLHEIASKAA